MFGVYDIFDIMNKKELLHIHKQGQGRFLVFVEKRSLSFPDNYIVITHPLGVLYQCFQSHGGAENEAGVPCGEVSVAIGVSGEVFRRTGGVMLQFHGPTQRQTRVSGFKLSVSIYVAECGIRSCNSSRFLLRCAANRTGKGLLFLRFIRIQLEKPSE